jgi:hypothetical protein
MVGLGRVGPDKRAGRAERVEIFVILCIAGVRLGVIPEVPGRNAIRGKWARVRGVDGRMRVWVPNALRASRPIPLDSVGYREGVGQGQPK